MRSWNDLVLGLLKYEGVLLNSISTSVGHVMLKNRMGLSSMWVLGIRVWGFNIVFNYICQILVGRLIGSEFDEKVFYLKRKLKMFSGLEFLKRFFCCLSGSILASLSEFMRRCLTVRGT